MGLVGDALGPEAIGGYLHGSTVLGGLRPASDLDGDTRNVVLTLARIWTTLATGEIGRRTPPPTGPSPGSRHSTAPS